MSDQGTLPLFHGSEPAIDPHRIRAITLHQPWASLLGWGLKRFETRSWPTKVRGPVAIHAAKTVPQYAEAAIFNDAIAEALKDHGYQQVTAMPLGVVVAIGTLDLCRPTAGGAPSELENEFGNWDAGRLAWRFRDVVQVVPPVAARGKQGFWWWRRP